MTCGIIVPRRDHVIGTLRKDGYLPQCILAQGHHTPHVFKTPEGKFFAWEDDMECDCCQPDEDERCYIWWEIQEEDIPKLPIQGQA